MFCLSDLEEQEFEDSLAMESSSHGFSSEENGPMSSRREILVSILPHPSNSISATNGLRGGTCPPPSPFALLALLSGSCGDECDADQDCPTGLKCCLGGCGLRCIPITSNERSPLPSLVNPVCKWQLTTFSSIYLKYVPKLKTIVLFRWSGWGWATIHGGVSPRVWSEEWDLLASPVSRRAFLVRLARRNPRPRDAHSWQGHLLH